MDSDDDDLFAISDDDVLSALTRPPQLPNPVEEQLLKQLNDVHDRIDAATNEIQEVSTTSAHILNALKWRAIYGEDVGSDSDSDVSGTIFIHSTFSISRLRYYEVGIR